MKRCGISLFLLFFGVAFVYSEVTSGADFLKIPRSARASALGNTSLSVVDEPIGLEMNPAALNHMETFAMDLLFQTWIDNSTGYYAVAGARLGVVTMGASFFLLDYGGFDAYDSFGALESSYRPMDWNVRTAFALDGSVLGDDFRNFSAGVGVSLIQKSLLDQSAWGGTLDLGLLYSTRLGKWFSEDMTYLQAMFGNVPFTAGLTLNNIGFSDETWTAAHAALGFAVGIFPMFNLYMDISKDFSDNPLEFRMGGEFNIVDVIALRAGFDLGKATQNLGLGVGLRIPFLYQEVRLDYAFVPLGTLGNNHQVSLYGEFLLDPTAKDYFRLAESSFRKENYLKARELYEMVLKKDPLNREAKERLEQVREKIRILELEMNTNWIKVEEESTNTLIPMPETPQASPSPLLESTPTPEAPAVISTPVPEVRPDEVSAPSETIVPEATPSPEAPSGLPASLPPSPEAAPEPASSSTNS